MTPRSMIAMVYVVAAACVAVINGPGAGALAGEIAMFAVFELPDLGLTDEPQRIAWEVDDLPAYLTEEASDALAAADANAMTGAELAEAPADLAPGAPLQ